MNGMLEEPRVWSLRRLAITAFIAFAVQVGLVYWFSASTPAAPRRANAQPIVQLAPLVHSELLSVMDPTLFARANPHGFSGPAWMVVPPRSYRLPASAEAPQWLALAPEELGQTFRTFLATNQVRPLNMAMRPRPAATPINEAIDLPMPDVSVVRVEGPLARRSLLAMQPLPPQIAPDILAPSRVRVLVDANGDPISAILLNSPGLRSEPQKAADELAVKMAGTAQFSPDLEVLRSQGRDPNAGLTSGLLIFQWHTLPAPTPTNGVNSANPR
jgi:hypothetical protein